MKTTKDVPAYSFMSRREDVLSLARKGGVGVELGVAEGLFSQRLLALDHLSHLYSVDMYAGDRGHDVAQYLRAIGNLSEYKGKNSLLRMRFDEAIELFPDQSLDFIYIDGYAHTGEEDGATFHQWWPKLAPGGVFAGDDYHPDWPDVIRNLDAFLEQNGLEAYQLQFSDSDKWSQYPTWFTIKPAAN